MARRRLPNDLAAVCEWLEPYRKDLADVVVESTYNWYWMVDGLQERGYPARLANTVAIQQYDGLKYRDDASDARWLAKLLRLGQLPEGHIYPREERAVRDLLRKRSQLVRQATMNILGIQNIFSRNRGQCIGANVVKRLTAESVEESFEDGNVALAVKSCVKVLHCVIAKELWELGGKYRRGGRIHPAIIVICTGIDIGVAAGCLICEYTDTEECIGSCYFRNGDFGIGGGVGPGQYDPEKPNIKPGRQRGHSDYNMTVALSSPSTA